MQLQSPHTPLIFGHLFYLTGTYLHTIQYHLGLQTRPCPNGIWITERATEDVASWPTDLILDLGKANWLE